MNKNQCEKTLREQYKKDFLQSDNISLLTEKARGQDKAMCFSQMGGITNIKNFLSNSKNNNQAILSEQNDIDIKHNSAQITNIKTTNNTTQTVSTNQSYIDFFAEAKYYGMLAIKIVFYIIITIIIFKFSIYLLSFLYDVFNIKRHVYLKTILPRGDGKTDREQDKELAKDMKEKIGRMAQVYSNMHRLGELTMIDNIMRWFFRKPKVTLMYHYENGELGFYIAVYPEYQKIIEGALSAQYPTCSIEATKRPQMFSKKYNSIIPMQPEKDSVYKIRLFKQMPDDPINNLIDSIAKIPRYDTFTIVMPLRPLGNKFNKRAKFVANALYKKEGAKVNGTPFWKYLIFPRKILDFFINGPSKELIESYGDDGSKGDPMIRMIKAQEEALNTMGEEATNPTFETGILLITSTDERSRLEDNLNLVISSYTIFEDRHGNRLDQPEKIADILGFAIKPLRRFAASFHLSSFFFIHNKFSTNELASLFHLPDAIYNRSNIVEWMQYKVLPAPMDLPMFSDFNGYIMSGKLAEKYKDGDLSEVLQEYKKHRAVGSKIVKEEKLEPVDKFSKEQLLDKEIVEKDGEQMVKVTYDKTVRGYKLSKEGVLLGINIYRNRYSPVYMKREDRTRHHYCIGKSGTGKSVYLQTLARQDVRNGDGICLIDPHGDLVEDMLEYIPKERAKDVIVFDAGNEDRPMGLNLYEIDHIDEADRTVNDATEIFLKMFGPEIFGPRIQEYFKFGSLTLLEDFVDRPTLLDVPRLFTDESYKEFKTRNIKNPVVKNFREKTYNAMGDREKKEIIPYFTSKFVSFNTNRLIRNIIGQTKSAFNISDVMNNRKVLLINLSKGKIGDLNAQLLGMILVSKIYNAAMSRARMPQNERKDFYLYVDEFQNFVSGTFADILSEARKYRLCLIMAHQYIRQLEAGKSLGGDEGGKGDVKAAVFGNVGTMQSFKVGAPDAEFLEKEYQPVLGGQDIVGIANYKAYIKLNINNATTRPFSMNTIYTSDYKNKKMAEILKEYSAKKYGRKREFVDAEMSARLGLGIEDEEETSDQTDA